MALLDVNALIALAWDAHVHHAAITRWFDGRSEPWATCPVSEAGFVRVSSNPKILTGALTVAESRGVLRELRDVGDHRFLANEASLLNADAPTIASHRQVTDALLLMVARRAEVPLVTFDAGLAEMADCRGVELLAR